MAVEPGNDSQNSAAADGNGVSTPEAGAGDRRRGRGVVARSGRYLFRTLLLLLLLATAVLGTGRLAMHALGSQQLRIASALENALGVPVQIASLEGRWTGWYPVLRITGLELAYGVADEATATAVAQAEAELDLWQSLVRRQPVLRGITLSGLQLSGQQQEDGSWRIAGLASGGGRFRDLLLDLLLQTPSIGITESDLNLQFSNGRTLALGSVYLSIVNELDRHRVAVQFRPGTEAAPLRLRVDLQGDPRGAFSGDAWLQLEDGNLQDLLALVLPETWAVDEAHVSATLWSRFTQAGLDSVEGELHGVQWLATASTPEQDPWQLRLTNGSLQLRAQTQPAPAAEPVWLVELRNLGVDVQGSPVDLPSLALHVPLAADSDWQLQVQSMTVAPVVQAVLGLPLPEAARSALETLEPAGELENLVLVSNRSGTFEDGFDLQANFRGLSVAAWKGAPAGENLDGYLRTGASRGLAEVDARDVRMEIPGLFREPWYYDTLNARVSWEVTQDGFRVASNPIHVSSEQLQGVVQFGLDTTQPGWRTRYPELTLLVGMERMDLDLRTAYLPQLSRISTTMDWLETALQRGSVRDSLFVLRTPTGGDPVLASATHASWFDAEQVNLQFLPDWPATEVASARVSIQDQKVEIEGGDALIAGITAQQVQGVIKPLPEGGSLLDLDIKAAAPLDAGLRFLRETPVRQYLGGVLDNWQAQGTLDLDVALAIGLGAEPGPPGVTVHATTDGSTLHLQDYALQLENIVGALDYTREAGLQATDLAATLFGSQAHIDITTQAGDARVIKVESAGRASVAALADWAGQPAFVSKLLDHLEGEFDYRARLDLPTGGSSVVPRLSLQSDLVGVTSLLPPPFAKAPELPSSLELDLAFASDVRNLQLRYGGGLSGELRLDAAGVDRGYLYLGPLNESFTIRQTDSAAEGLLVSGSLDALDYDAWEALAPSLDSGAGGKGLKDYLRLVDVDVARLLVRGQEFENINVQVQYSGDTWRIQARNDLLAGSFSIPESDAQAWNVDLEYLRLPPREIPEPGQDLPEVDALEFIDPTTLPAFDFHTDELAIGELQLGSWAFRFAPHASGASIRELRMEEASSRIFGMPVQLPENQAGANAASEAPGASLDWNYADGMHESRFEGVFAAGDLARVMPLWGHDANIVSSSADFRGQLSWPGSPLAFSLRKASGALDMGIEDGRFVDIDSGSSRLLGAFNFDALVRRLELDFSDLYQRGFTFDDIHGELDFVDGVVHTRSPLVIEGPSSQLTITGEIDLDAETIMADMLVRIPLGENISLLAGLLGAWPIAVSTYLASKIFADQVEDFTTIIYRLEGPWANPSAGFEAPEENANP